MNIILISCDSLRADHLGCYGYARPTSPYIDQIAASGALFEQAFGADIPTEPVHTALFTGLSGLETGIVAHGAQPHYLTRDTSWLPGLLWRAGYQTMACDNLYQLKEWFARGFRYYINTVSKQRAINGDEVNAEAIPWLRAHASSPFFLFLHFWDPHTPYLVPQTYQRLFYDGDPYDPAHGGMERVRAQTIYPFFYQYHYRHLGPVTDPAYISALYDAEIRYLDNCLAQLDAELAALGVREDTLLIVMGDHGESLYEHDIYWDHAGLYDATIRVPIIMRWPGHIAAGWRSSALVQHIDLFPTLLEAAGVRDLPPTAGQSLWPLLRGESREPRCRTYHAECNWQAARAVRTSEWKLIRNIDPWEYQRPPLELYNLRSDPGETNNLADIHPEIAAELHADLEQWLARGLAGRPDPIMETLAAAGMPARLRMERALAAWGIAWEDWRRHPDLHRLGLAA